VGLRYVLQSVMELTRTILPCERCRVGVPIEDLIVNWGLCNDCFETNCPCNDGKPDSCPLHRYPDIILNYGSERG